jgi:hypothetical protein
MRGGERRVGRRGHGGGFHHRGTEDLEGIEIEVGCVGVFSLLIVAISDTSISGRDGPRAVPPLNPASGGADSLKPWKEFPSAYFVESYRRFPRAT